MNNNYNPNARNTTPRNTIVNLDARYITPKNMKKLNYSDVICAHTKNECEPTNIHKYV